MFEYAKLTLFDPIGPILEILIDALLRQSKYGNVMDVHISFYISNRTKSQRDYRIKFQ